MKSFFATLVLAVSLLFASTANAQTLTYTVVPSLCGTATNFMQCTIDLSPESQLGVYPTLHMSDDLINDSGGLVDWAGTLGLTGHYLGGGVIEQGSTGRYLSYPTFSQVCSNGVCSQQATSLTVFFIGTYIGGGNYSGYYTIQMSYRYQYGGYRQSSKWIRTVTSGLVTLTE